ncbi:rho guanine nucleotide exchange factor 4-like [Heptranchias perlo]|uniref:rho guanine nucleotide exchange factor 4-like n=1 Tax=Heptranchias perlo TaxID=212740 RepID=UPI0035597936
MSSLLNCIKLIINAWLGHNDPQEPGKSPEDSMEIKTLSLTKTETLLLEPSKDNVMSKNNVIISEMLASLSILEEAEAQVIKKHRMHHHYPMEELSEILELASKEDQAAEDQETNEEKETETNEPPSKTQQEQKPPPETLTNQDQRRVNIIIEIITTERDYVKNLSDIVEGYFQQCQKAKDLFPHARLYNIFSNIEDIYKAQKKFLASIEKKYKSKKPHLSEFGSCFLDHQKGFLLYAEYCNNHSNALNEWAKLIKVEKYAYFFELCRLHQQMISLPLDGFLIIPVQKICKYPLLLKELLRATPPQHKDYKNLEAAVIAMKNVLNVINARTGDQETEDKMLQWQNTISNWQGEDLSIRSTELINRGDLIVVQQPGMRAKNFVAFLFDHQMILCKKDLLRRNTLYYKACIDIDSKIVVDVEDGRDLEFDCKVKHAIKLKSKFPDVQPILLFTKSLPDRQLWLHAFEEERIVAEGERDADDTHYYDFPALNVSTVTQEQLSFLAQPKRRRSSFWRKFKILNNTHNLMFVFGVRANFRLYL